ncbi:MopE-related protein [Thermodesulfobacteriota bacterium]
MSKCVVMLVILMVLTMMAIGGPAFGDTLLVPGEFATIQGCIDAASEGDECVVAPGNYQENIDFLGKGITVRSEAGPASTVIEGGASGSTVLFQSGEPLSARLIGLTISNGSGTEVELPVGEVKTLGGGILCIDGSSPFIQDNVIVGNAADVGAGISCFSSSPFIDHNHIRSNTANDVGGGIDIFDSEAQVTFNTLFDNFAWNQGAGISVANSSPFIASNVITLNTDPFGKCAGIYVLTSSGTIRDKNLVTLNGGNGISLLYSDTEVTGNVINGNNANQAGGGLFLSHSDSLVALNEIFNNTAAAGGGGIACGTSNAVIVGNQIKENVSQASGGGIACYSSSPTIANNTFFMNVSNPSLFGGGIFLSFESSPLITNNIVAHSPVGDGIHCTGDSWPVITFNDVYGNDGEYGGDCADQTGVNGNISAEPLIHTDGYHLLPDSPCIDVGDNTAPSMTAADWEGDVRVIDGDDNGSDVVDMGADEFDACDLDYDGYDHEACGGDDCDDENGEVHPGHDEVPDNGVDDDCDGEVDEGGCFVGVVR